MKKTIALLLIVALFPIITLAQGQDAQKQESTEDSKKTLWLKLELLRSCRRQLTDGIVAMQNPVAQVWSQMRTADTLVEHEPEEAKRLLLGALQNLLLTYELFESFSKHTNIAKEEQEQLASLVADVIAKLAPFPQEKSRILANKKIQQILRDSPDFWLKIGHELANMDPAGKEIMPPPNATLSLRGPALQITLQNLLALRSKYPSSANFLFQKAVEDAVEDPPDLAALLSAGAYLFHSANAVGINWLKVGDAIFADISGNKIESVSAELVRWYLRSIISVLSKPADSSQEALRRAGLAILSPIVETYLAAQPELVSKFNFALREAEKEPATLVGRAIETPDVGNTVEECLNLAYKIPDKAKRDDFITFAVKKFRQTTAVDRLNRVLELIGLVNDLSLRNDLTSLVETSIVDAHLFENPQRKSDIQAARLVAGKIVHPLARGLSWLKIAHYHASRFSAQNPVEINQALGEVEAAAKKVEGVAAAELLMHAASIAEILIINDRYLNLERSLVTEAIVAANRVPKEDKQAFEFLEKDRVSFTIGGIELDPPQIDRAWTGMRFLADQDPQTVVILLLRIENEAIRAVAIPRVISLFVQSEKVLQQKIGELEKAEKKK